MTILDLAQAERFARAVASSSLIPQAYRGKPADIIVAIQMGHELGLKPTVALRSIAVLNGRPALYGDAALAVVMGSGKLAAIKEDVTGAGEDLKATCYVRRTAPAVERTVIFTGQDARRAGLLGKPGPWTQFPARMAQMRARAFALRDVFPDLLSGNLAEEFDGLPAETDARDITPPPAPPDTVTWIDQYGAERETTAAEQTRQMLDIVSAASTAELAELCAANAAQLPPLVLDAIAATDRAIKLYTADGTLHGVYDTHHAAIRTMRHLIDQGSDRLAVIAQNRAILRAVAEHDPDARWRDGAAAMLAELNAAMQSAEQ